jgi:hypothetical protein
MQVERRQEMRVVMPDEEIVVMGPHSNSIGVLKDISMAGMKFEYISEKPASDQWERVDILANRQDHVLVPSVPCTIAYDLKGMASNRSFTGLCVRVCGVCFGTLTAAQAENLQNLLARQEVC